jgi:peptidoglycan hydrolase CwlO-like protein
MAIFWPFSADAGLPEEISARNQQIEQIQKQIDAYQQQIEENSAKATTLASEINTLNAQISKIQLEIKSLGIAIDQTSLEIQDTQGGIKSATDQLQLQKEVLAKYMRILYELDKENLTRVLLSNAKLSDFFNNLKNLGDIQNSLQTTIVSVKNLKADLEQKESNLEDKKSEMEQLKGLQQAQKGNLDTTKSEKGTILTETKGQEAKFQQLVKQSQADIARIQDQISYLIQNGVTVEDAIKFGELAAIRVGIRPAFLIAILDVESGLGKNVGKGNWLEDMYNCYLRLGKPSRAEAEKTAFFEIVNKLGLDPNTVKVSAEPNYGCGGALGPAQFIATTWLAYESQVASLTGHQPPNPWNIEDAFMASAVKLGNAGATAQTRTKEIAAAKAYLSGNSNCSSRICNYYASTVLDKAAIIAQSL